MNNSRSRVVDAMITLLTAFKKYDVPFLTVKFWIKASNENIEQYLIDTVRTEGDGCNRLSDEKIASNIRNDIENFHNSVGYCKDGMSEVAFNQFMTLDSITFEKVKELLDGNDESLPKEYEFKGFDI